MIKKIGLITSGGDSPGMNACIRAVVRTARAEQIDVVGFYRGYEGLIDDDHINLTKSKVSNIIHRGLLASILLFASRSSQYPSRSHDR